MRATLEVEYPSRHITFTVQEFGVFEYGEYPRSSVLAGEERRSFKGGYSTLAEALRAHPTAIVTDSAADAVVEQRQHVR